MISQYRPGTSAVHRAPAWLKLAALALVAVAVSLATPHRPPLVLVGLLGGAAALLVAVHLVAGLGLGELARQAWALRWLVVVMAVPQLVFLGPLEAGVNMLRIVLLVLIAGIVTLTTPMSALLDVLERLVRPLALVGLPPERVALLLALTISTVPVVAGMFAQVREAQRARGIRSAWRPVLPLLVLSLRHADELGDALKARGVH